MSLACPIDNKDNTIQKVSAVVAGGTSTGSFSGLTSGVVDVDGKTGNLGGFSTLTGGTKSNLASFLASPRMPHQPSNMNLLIIFIAFWASIFLIGLGGAGVFITTLGLKNSFMGSTALLTLTGIAIAIGSGISLFFVLRFIIRADKNSQKEIWEDYLLEKTRWEKSTQKWNRLYYCHKHGIVFDPEIGDYCEPSELQKYIDKSVTD